MRMLGVSQALPPSAQSLQAHTRRRCRGFRCSPDHLIVEPFVEPARKVLFLAWISLDESGVVPVLLTIQSFEQLAQSCRFAYPLANPDSDCAENAILGHVHPAPPLPIESVQC